DRAVLRAHSRQSLFQHPLDERRDLGVVELEADITRSVLVQPGLGEVVARAEVAGHALEAAQGSEDAEHGERGTAEGGLHVATHEGAANLPGAIEIAQHRVLLLGKDPDRLMPEIGWVTGLERRPRIETQFKQALERGLREHGTVRPEQTFEGGPEGHPILRRLWL